MAVTNEQLLVQIGLDTSNASKSIDVLTKELVALKTEFSKVGKSTEKTSDVLTGFGGKMVALNSTLSVAKMAFQSVVNSIKPFITEYANAQDETKKLTNMLQLFGDYTPEIVADFENWADALENTTTANGGLALTLATTAKSMGLSNDMAKKLVETASNLSAATGDTMEQSFQALTMTLKGNARALGENAILLSDLTEKELQAGKGVERIAQIFEGQATAALNTFSGQMQYAANMLDKLMENIGSVIAESFGLNDMASTTADAFKNLAKWIEENRSEIVAWGKTISATVNSAVTLMGGLWTGFMTAISGLTGGLYKLGQAFGFVAEKIGLMKPETYEKIKEAADAQLDRTKELAQVTGMAFSDAFDSGSKLEEQMKKTEPAIKAAGAAFKGMGFGAREALKEVEGIIKDLEKRIVDSNKNIASIGATEAQAIEAKRIASQGELNIIEEKLKSLDQLKGKQLELLEINRKIANEAAAKELAVTQKKNLDDLISKNQELYLNLNKDTMLQNDLIDAQTKMLLDQLDIKTRNMALDESGVKALEEQQKLIKQSSEQQKKKAGSAQYQALEQTGKNIASGVSDALKTGVGGLISGFASMLNGVMAAIDAVAGIINTILDFIPKVLDTVSSILNKITDLPNVILTSVKNLGTAILDFVGKFIPNLLKSIPEIVNGLIKTLFVELPKVFIEMVKSLPKILIDAFKALTENIDELVSALIAAMPEMAIAFVETVIKEGPRIAFAILKTIYIELPKAIIKGIIDGVKRLGNLFKNIFGKGSKIQVDQKQISSVVKDLGKKLSGEAGKLFAVVDLEAAQKTAEKTAAIETAVTDGINKIKGVWQQLIDGLLAAWRWIYDNILSPVFNAIRNAWLWVYNTIIKPLIDGLTYIWQWVGNNIVIPLISGLEKVFVWVVDNVITPISEAIMSAFQWVIDNVIDPFLEIGKKIAEPIIEAFKKVGTMFTGLFDGLKALFKFDFAEAGKQFKAVFTDAFELAFAPLKTMFNAFIDLLNGLRLPEVRVEGKVLGKSFGFTLIPDIDLIPGEIARFAAGGFVGQGTDTVPAMLTPGEFVVNRNAVQSLGSGAMNAINNGVAPVQNTTFNIELNIETTEPVTEDFVRNRLLPRVRDEFKRASLDGQFVLSSKGIR